MELRSLGRSGLQVPPLCFGGNVFGWTVDEASSFRLLDAIVERGLTFIDTADVYSRWHDGNEGGESESIIGRWLKRSGKRREVTIATKVGMDMGDGKVGLKAEYIARAVEDSLRRLQTDIIDLYQSHKDDETTPQAETLAAFDKLIKAGKVRAIGASNFAPARFQEALDLARADGLPRYETMQPLYNMHSRKEYETGLAPICGQNDVAVIPYSSLASGFLTGKYRSEADYGKSLRGPRSIPKYMDERGVKILAELDDVAAETGQEQAAVALAWLIAQPTVTAPIVSVSRIDQLGTLLAAVELKLSDDQLQRLTDASAY